MVRARIVRVRVRARVGLGLGSPRLPLAQMTNSSNCGHCHA